MEPKLPICTQGLLGRWVDTLFEPVMRYISSGAPEEMPQRTHRWNNHHLKEEKVAHLKSGWMAAHSGDPNASSAPHILAHLTRYGGWDHYLVLSPKTEENCSWHIGWQWSGGAGVSRVPVEGPVRVLVGPKPTKWFGINAETHTQIPIQQIGKGKIGRNKEFFKIPLF